MNREQRRQFEEFRRTSGPVENQVIDDLLVGELGRREFLKRGALFGLSVSALSGALLAAGETPVAFARTVAPVAGGRMRLAAYPPPSGDIEPHLFGSAGQITIGSIVGEFLIRATSKLTLQPELATSWEPNAKASVWTVKLRSGVKFQSGQTLKADDVVTTFKRLTDKGSAALSAFQGVLSPAGVQKVDDLTVQFTLDAPTASFPYLLSSATYQAIILPADYKLGTFTTTPQCTGAFKLVSYTPGVGAKYERFDGWWGGRAPLDGVDTTIYSDAAAQDVALLSGSVDLLAFAYWSTDRPVFKSPTVQIFQVPSSQHRLVPMRTDIPPFNDPRVRRALALTLDRPGLVKKLLGPTGVVGNDSMFSPVYPTTVAVEQRRRSIALAKQLMAAAGKAKGFDVAFTVESAFEMSAYAQLIQAAAKQIGINLKIKLMPDSAYFAGTQSGGPSGLGNTPWLNTPINITSWGHRPVPNQFLTAAFTSKGVWNASHYKSKAFDALVKGFVGAIALADQRKYAKQIELLMLNDTPAIYGFFVNTSAAGSKKVKGFEVNSNTSYMSRASLA